MRSRQCALTTTQHLECETLFKSYAPLYNSLGYGSNYVQTYAHGAHGATTVTQASSTHPISTVTGSTYYAPKTTVALSHDMRNNYANMLSHQSSYLAKHEAAMKATMVDGVHPYGDVNSYYYHLEQQRSLIDDLHYRVQHGDYYNGYYYNPYYNNGYNPYGYGNTVVTDVNSVQGVHNAIPDTDVEEDELSTGAIAGIVIGSVVGFLLILAIICAVCGAGRSR